MEAKPTEQERKKIVAGLDISKEYIQISYLFEGIEKPVTLRPGAGEEYNIPMCLAKRLGVNQWFFGKEAIQYATEKETMLITNLLSKTIEKEVIVVEGIEIQAEELFTLFCKKCFSLLRFFMSGNELSALMITVELLDKQTAEVLEAMAKRLPVEDERIFFEGRQESLYHYLLNQPEELWHYQVGVFDFTSRNLKSYTFSRNVRTTPIIALIEKEEYALINGLSEFDSKELEAAYYQSLDEGFMEILIKYVDGKILSSIYFIGQGFLGQWYKESLKFLCKSRRVFEGNNLYSKGAAYGARAKVKKTEIEQSHIYLGEDKLKYNVGIMVEQENGETYFPLLNGGTNWHEAKGEWVFLLKESPYVSILLTDLTGASKKAAVISLEEKKIRKGYATRLRLKLYMKDWNSIWIELEDEGFGETFLPEGILYDGELPEATAINTVFPCNIKMCIGQYSEEPYYVNRMKKGIHFIEELCYYIFTNAHLLDHNFISEKLVNWIEEEWKLPKLAHELRKQMHFDGSLYNFAAILFNGTGYVSKKQSEQIGKILKDNEFLSIEKRQKKLADYLFTKEHYVLAIEEYRKLLHTNESMDTEFYGSVLHNIGSAYARLFYYKAAAAWFKQAYELTNEKDEMEAFLCCTRLHLSKKEYINLTTDSEEYYKDAVLLEEKMADVAEKWEESPESKEIEALCRLRMGNRTEYYKELDLLLEKWKDEYINKVMA